MKQSLFASWFETLANTATGFAISLALQYAVCWWHDLPLRIQDNLAIIAVFTVASLLRGIAWRRLMERLHVRNPLSPGALAIVAERRRQQEVEGWTEYHDDEHRTGELAMAGASYACSARAWAYNEKLEDPPIWPWARAWWKPTDLRRDLVKAGALILAELDRFDRTRHHRRAA